MNTAGWITLILSVGSVSLLFVFCIFKVLTNKAEDHTLGHVEPIDSEEAEER